MDRALEKGAKAVLISGNEKAFSAGFDLAIMAKVLSFLSAFLVIVLSCYCLDLSFSCDRASQQSRLHCSKKGKPDPNS
jgi:enoyl-CoA hydratase/carnithine racemase